VALSSLNLNVDLATKWRGVLEGDGLNVRKDDGTRMQGEDARTRQRVSEIIWRVGNGSDELQILEATYHDRQDGGVYLVFKPSKTQREHQLFLVVQQLLVEAGATVGAGNRTAK
jgi:hypothetical protein